MLSTMKKRPFYTEVEYLESTGTQYIDTEYKLSTGTTHTFNGNIEWRQSLGNANFFYGYRSVDSAEYRGDMRAFFVYGSSAPPAGRLAIRYGVNTDNSTSTISQNQKYNISFDGTNLKIDGTTFTSVSSAYTPADYRNMYLFYCNCTGYYSADVAHFAGRIYNWQIFEDGVAVRDFIPVLDWNYTPCMYDKVTGQLFYNKGTGTFSYGREIHHVDYLESDGTQYIDTKYIPNINTECSMNLAFVSLDSIYRTPFSVRTADGAANSFTIMSSRSLNDNNSFAFGSNYWSGSGVPRVVLDKTVKAVLRKGYASWDGVSGNPGTTITPASLTAYMFARNSNGTAANFFIGRIYDCQIKDNNVLVRDYLPAIDQNGVGFMFDRVSHTCYLNAGSGSFKYPAREIEYLENDGTDNYINTNWIPDANAGVELKAQFTAYNGQLFDTILGVRAQGDNTRYYPFTVTENGSKIRSGYGSDNNYFALINFDTNIHEVKFNVGDHNVYIDGTNKITLSPSKFATPNYPAFLFGTNLTGWNGSGSYETKPSGWRSKARIWYCKLYNNSVLAKDYIPVFQDGSAGMLDKLTGTLYTNQGAGSGFTVGKIKEPEYE